MSPRVEEASASPIENPSGSRILDAAAAITKAGINGKGGPSLQPTDALAAHSDQAASPAVDSLLSMMNLQADSATLELYLAEIVQSSRDTANRIGKSKINLLTNEKLAQLKERQDKITSAERKLEEAQRLQTDSKLWSYVRFGISLFAAVTSSALVASGVGAGAGMLLASFALATVSAANEGVTLATGKGMAGAIGNAFGANKDVTMWCDAAFGVTLAAASLLFLFGPLGLVAAPAAVKGLDAASSISSGAIGIKNAETGFSAGTAMADGMRLNGMAKELEARIQQMDAYLQQAADNMIASNERNNQLVSELVKTYADLSSAMARVRFAS